MQTLLMTIGACAVLMTVQSCSGSRSYSNEQLALDTMLDRLDSAEAVFNAIDVTRAAAMTREINSDVEHIAAHFTTDMMKETGAIISQYKGTAKVMKDWAPRYRRIAREIGRTRSQLIGFKEALAAKATVDGDGTAITPDYVSRVFNQETTVAEHLMEEIEEMNALFERAEENYQRMKPAVDRVLAELPEKQ